MRGKHFTQEPNKSESSIYSLRRKISITNRNWIIPYTPESKFTAEEVEGPAAAELIKEALPESESDCFVEEDFDLKENSLLLRKMKAGIPRPREDNN